LTKSPFKNGKATFLVKWQQMAFSSVQVVTFDNN